jgi:thiol-disulfide isomerase/thioredoxin
MFPIIRRFALIVAVAFTANSAFADPAADEAWKKVEEIMKKPITLPRATPKTSREERMALLKSKFDARDTAIKEFLAVAPNDPRRWQAKLYEAQNICIRANASTPLGPNMMVVFDEIAAAPDAPVAVKGEASALKLLIKGLSMPEADWQKLAEQHLQAYPETSLNQTIQATIAWRKLKSEPLDWKFTALDGTEVDLAKMRGKVVLIHFWATWCGTCVHGLPNVVKAYEALHSKGFEILGISLDKAKLESFVKENGMAWPQYFDGKGWKNEISSRFDIEYIPEKWLVNKKGMMVSRDHSKNLQDEVEKLLAE